MAVIRRAAIALALAGAVFGCGARKSTPVPRAAGPVALAVREKTLTANGKPLPLGGRLDEWTKVLGPPSRRVDRAGGMHVWDDLGLAVTLRLPFPESDPRVAALWIFFAARDVDFWPRHLFAGPLAVTQPGEKPDDREVTGRLDDTTTMSALEHQGFSWRHGFPSLSRYTSLRFRPPRGDGPLEICFVQIAPDFVGDDPP